MARDGSAYPRCPPSPRLHKKKRLIMGSHPKQQLNPKMKNFIDHIKQVAIQDFRDFFAPFVWVIRSVRSLASAIFNRIKSRSTRNKKGDQ